MNWDAIRDEVTRLTQDLIRFDTTNPPGNETPCIETIAAVLRREGIEPVVLESARDAGWRRRLKGDGSQPPILLMGHVDVVPAEADHWQRPPFSGDLVDGIVWGRGAVTDMKQMVAMELMTLLLLKRAGAPPPDAGGPLKSVSSSWSMPTKRPAASWAPASSPPRHPDLIRDAEVAINEGGRDKHRAGRQAVLRVLHG